MDRLPVASSHVVALGHDPRTGTLEVEFHNGKVYEYQNVSEAEVEAIFANKSPGAHFAKTIRARRPGKRIA